LQTLQANIKLYFYDIEGSSVDVYVYEDNKHTSFKNGDIVDLNFNKFNFKEVVLTINNRTYNITNTIREVKHNTLDIL
jgi:catechol-2,3-dioxygenase